MAHVSPSVIILLASPLLVAALSIFASARLGKGGTRATGRTSSSGWSREKTEGTPPPMPQKPALPTVPVRVPPTPIPSMTRPLPPATAAAAAAMAAASPALAATSDSESSTVSSPSPSPSPMRTSVRLPSTRTARGGRRRASAKLPLSWLDSS